jgi:hypothetical protein
MKYLINGTLRLGRSREELVEKVRGKPISDETWECAIPCLVTSQADLEWLRGYGEEVPYVTGY